MVTPKPAHHLGQHGTGMFLAVSADTPDIVHVIASLCHSLRHADILIEPVAVLMVLAIPAYSAVVVAPVLQEDAQGLLLALSDRVGTRFGS